MDILQSVLRTLERERVIAILRTDDPARAGEAAEAAIAGGLRVIEFTMGIPNAIDLVRAFSGRESIVVGVGTVLHEEEARAAIDAGARFLVSPVLDTQLLSFVQDRGILMIPGVATPTEIWQAIRVGARVVKVFPQPSGGPEWIRAIRGPMPFVRMIPTHGVTVDNILDYLAAGAFAVGMTRTLFHPEDMAHGRWSRITARARVVVDRIRRYRRGS